MKAVILAGGFGSRLSEETIVRPKPMVEIGGKPILWHIMNIYSAQGVNEFIIAVGYKAEFIKEYFLNFQAFNNDISIDLSNSKVTIHNGNHSEWKVHLVDTGLYTETGGRSQASRKMVGKRRRLHVHVRRWCSRHRYQCPATVSQFPRETGDRDVLRVPRHVSAELYSKEIK